MKYRATSHSADLLEQRFQSGILQELQEYLYFVTWIRTEQGKKLPIHPRTSKVAGAIDPTSWTALDIAIETLKQGKGQGVGFALATDNPL